MADTDTMSDDPIVDAILGAPEEVPPADSKPVNEEVESQDTSEEEKSEEDSELAALEDDEVEQESVGHVPDDYAVSLMVDGEERSVKFSELKSNFSLGQATEKRLQQASELRNGYYQVGQQLYDNLQQQGDRLTKFDAVLKDIAEPDINWVELRQRDPAKYLIERDNARIAQEKRDLISKEQERVSQEQKRLLEINHQVSVQAETGKFLEKMPELRDPEKANAFVTEMTNMASKVYGFEPELLAGVADHRQLLVLADALKYRRLLARKAEKNTATTNGARPAPKLAPSAMRPLMKPGGNPNFGAKMQESKRSKELVSRARSSGSVDDVAATLLVRRSP